MKMLGRGASLGPNMSFEGKMEVDGELRVDGRLKGELICRRLVVSSEGLFEGRAEVSDVLIEGGVTGEIVAHGLVTIRRGAKVMADILYKTLAMEEGSFFNGKMGLVGSRTATH